jgi:hypothetical protein
VEQVEVETEVNLIHQEQEVMVEAEQVLQTVMVHLEYFWNS